MQISYKVDRKDTGTFNIESPFEEIKDGPKFIESLIEQAESSAFISSVNDSGFPVRLHIVAEGAPIDSRVYQMVSQGYLQFIDAADDMLLIAAGKKGETVATDVAEMKEHGVLPKDA